MKLSAGPRPAK